MYRIGEEEVEAVRRVIASKKLFKVNVALQESLHAEEDLREYFKTPYAILMTSGHAALVSALTALGIGPGDQVIVPAYTYIATAMAVVAVGAIPVIAEVDETLTISPEDVEKKITPATKAIFPVLGTFAFLAHSGVKIYEFVMDKKGTNENLYVGTSC